MWLIADQSRLESETMEVTGGTATPTADPLGHPIASSGGTFAFDTDETQDAQYMETMLNQTFAAAPETAPAEAAPAETAPETAPAETAPAEAAPETAPAETAPAEAAPATQTAAEVLPGPAPATAEHTAAVKPTDEQRGEAAVSAHQAPTTAPDQASAIPAPAPDQASAIQAPTTAPDQASAIPAPATAKAESTPRPKAKKATTKESASKVSKKKAFT